MSICDIYKHSSYRLLMVWVSVATTETTTVFKLSSKIPLQKVVNDNDAGGVMEGTYKHVTQEYIYERYSAGYIRTSRSINFSQLNGTITHILERNNSA
jgi:hypothetical protein